MSGQRDAWLPTHCAAPMIDEWLKGFQLSMSGQRDTWLPTHQSELGSQLGVESVAVRASGYSEGSVKAGNTIILPLTLYLSDPIAIPTWL